MLAQLDEVNLPTFPLATASVLALFIAKRFAPKLPGPLLVMLAAAALAHFAGLRAQGVRVVGEVPSGLPGVVIPDFTGVDWTKLLPAAPPSSGSATMR